MKSVPSSVLILIMFVSIYIFCVSTYTFIAALNNVNLWIEKEGKPEDSNGLSRPKREGIWKMGLLNVLLSDSWKMNVTFNMCCKEYEILNSKFECVKSNTTGIVNKLSEKAELLSEVAVVDENLTQNFVNMSRIFLKYDTGKFCPRDEITVLTWPPGKPYSYYISQKDGQILELSEDIKSVISRFSTASYCLNQMQGREKHYAALLCPCNEKVCIQKCCKKGDYYNFKENACKKEENIKSYKPTFYDKNVETSAKISYNLIHNSLNCSGPDKLLEDGPKPSPLYIQPNGQLMLILEEENVEVFVDKKQYCVDVFFDGNNTSYVNGFYCQNDIGLDIVTMENMKKNEKELPIIKAFHSSVIKSIANINLFIMALAILFFVI